MQKLPKTNKERNAAKKRNQIVEEAPKPEEATTKPVKKKKVAWADMEDEPKNTAKVQKKKPYEMMQNFNLPPTDEDPAEVLWYGQGSNDEAVVDGAVKEGTRLAGHRSIQLGTDQS